MRSIRARREDFFAAAVLALESGDPGQFDRVIERAYATAEKAPGEPYHTAYDPWRGIVSALAWVDRAHAAVYHFAIARHAAPAHTLAWRRRMRCAPHGARGWHRGDARRP